MSVFHIRLQDYIFHNVPNLQILNQHANMEGSQYIRNPSIVGDSLSDRVAISSSSRDSTKEPRRNLFNAFAMYPPIGPKESVFSITNLGCHGHREESTNLIWNLNREGRPWSLWFCLF